MQIAKPHKEGEDLKGTVRICSAYAFTSTPEGQRVSSGYEL